MATHPFRPQCVMEQARAELWVIFRPAIQGAPEATKARASVIATEITSAVDAGLCPRCRGPLGDDPVGSSATACRCVPICRRCAEIEPYLTRRFRDAYATLAERIGAVDDPASSLTHWPVTGEEGGNEKGVEELLREVLGLTSAEVHERRSNLWPPPPKRG